VYDRRTFASAVWGVGYSDVGGRVGVSAKVVTVGGITGMYGFRRARALGW
jgi:hypothetical protein